MITAGDDVTLNRPDPMSGTPLVVTMTSLGPGVAPAATEIAAVKLVGLTKLTLLTVTPAPKLTVDPALKVVFKPVIVTLRVWFCWAVGGLTLVICGAAAVTLNRLTPVTGVPLVVTVTSRAPTVAPEAIVMFAVRLTGLLNVTPLTVIPLPKLTVEPVVKLVFDPAIVTFNVWPCWPEGGVTLVICAGMTVTVKSPTPVTGEPAVVTVTSRGPAVAPASIVMLAPRLVALLKETEFTATPAPKVTVEAAVKFVP